MIKTKDHFKNRGFTIVELLVVIVVIGILAAITIVSYSGITRRAIISSMQSDLASASTQLKIFQTTNDSYPQTISTDCVASPTTLTNLCLKPSRGSSYTGYTTTAQGFTLTETNGDLTYRITENSRPTAYVPCPAGFITVPGSATYGTNEFCTMKYDAKNVGGVATSQAALSPWVSVNQAQAVAAAATACSGCHLITEAEWLTIAQNVLSVADNWSSGVVGTGFIYGGHSDGVPNNALVADTDDGNGYFNTGNVAPSNQRRTLTLTNGEVIWDLSGNIWKWTAGQTTGGQPGITSGGLSWREYPALTNPGTLSVNPSPSIMGLAGSSTWDSTNGIGRIYSNTESAILQGMQRGSLWDVGSSYSGVLTLFFSGVAATGTHIGFRVSR